MIKIMYIYVILDGHVIIKKKEKLFVVHMNIWLQKYLNDKIKILMLIYGHWVFYYMNYLLIRLHLKMIICLIFINK